MINQDFQSSYLGIIASKFTICMETIMLKQISTVIQQEMEGVSLSTLMIVSVWACVLVCVFFLIRSLLFHKDSSLTTILLFLVGTVYLCGLVYITLGSRELGSRDASRWIPFQQLTQNGRLNMTAFILMILNIVLFLPLGIFTTLEVRKVRYLYGFIIVCLNSFLISVIIEMIQRVTKLGYFELEDIICNTFGGFLGWAIITLFLCFLRIYYDKRRTSMDF